MTTHELNVAHRRFWAGVVYTRDAQPKAPPQQQRPTPHLAVHLGDSPLAVDLHGWWMSATQSNR